MLQTDRARDVMSRVLEDPDEVLKGARTEDLTQLVQQAATMNVDMTESARDLARMAYYEDDPALLNAALQSVVKTPAASAEFLAGYADAIDDYESSVAGIINVFSNGNVTRILDELEGDVDSLDVAVQVLQHGSAEQQASAEEWLRKHPNVQLPSSTP